MAASMTCRQQPAERRESDSTHSMAQGHLWIGLDRIGHKSIKHCGKHLTAHGHSSHKTGRGPGRGMRAKVRTRNGGRRKMEMTMKGERRGAAEVASM